MSLYKLKYPLFKFRMSIVELCEICKKKNLIGLNERNKIAHIEACKSKNKGFSKLSQPILNFFSKSILNKKSFV